MTVLTWALMAFLPAVSTRLCKAAPPIPMDDLLRVRCVPSALLTRQLVARMLRDNRRGATVFPKWHFAVTPIHRPARCRRRDALGRRGRLRAERGKHARPFINGSRPQRRAPAAHGALPWTGTRRSGGHR